MDCGFIGNPHLARDAHWAPRITTKLPPGLGFENSPYAVQFYPRTATGCDTAAEPGNHLPSLPNARLDRHRAPIPSQNPSQYYDTEANGHLTGAWRSTQPVFVFCPQEMTDEELQAPMTFPMNQPQHLTAEDRRLVTHTDRRTRNMVEAIGVDYDVDCDQFADPTDAVSRPPPSIYGPGLVPTVNDVELPKVKTASTWTGSSDEGLKRRFRAHLQATASAKRQDVETEEGTKEEDKEYRLYRGDPRAGRNEPSARKTQHLGSTWTAPRAEATVQSREEEDMQGDEEHRIQGNGLLESLYAAMAARRAENRGNVHTRGPLGRTQDIPSCDRANVNVHRGRLLGVARNVPEAEAAAKPNRFPRPEASEHISPETLRFFPRHDPPGSGLRPDNGGGSHRRPSLEPESPEEEPKSYGEDLDTPAEEFDSSGEEPGSFGEEGESSGGEEGESPGEEGGPVSGSNFNGLSHADIIRYLEDLP